MANAYLGIGHGSTSNYITAEDTAKFNVALNSYVDFISDYLNKFSYIIVDNNHITVKKGICSIQGRPVFLRADTTLTIDNGTTGYNRIDLISMRLTRDIVTGIEEANLIVIKGTPTIGTPPSPSVNTGDFNGVVNTLDFVIYSVLISNLVIMSATLIPSVKYALDSRLLTAESDISDLQTTIDTKQESLKKGDFPTGNFDTLSSYGTYNITGTTLTNQPVAEIGELSVSAATTTSPIFQTFITVGTNPRIFHRIIGKNWVELTTTSNSRCGQITKTGTGVSYLGMFTLTEVRAMFGVGIEKTANNFVCTVTNADNSITSLLYQATAWSGASLVLLLSGNLANGINAKINYRIDMF